MSLPIVLPPPPPASSDAARRVLSRTARRDTAPELALRRALFARGMRYLVDAPVPGCGRRRRVDVLLRGARIAVLVHGCFWHSCPLHFHPPKANAEWWRQKMASIRERDADTLARLEQAGWLPVVVWEHEQMEEAASRVQALVAARVGPGVSRGREPVAGHDPLVVPRSGTRSADEVGG